MAADADRLRELLAAVADGGRLDGEPTFYAVVGGHCYGWADAASDVDVRGFHVADGLRYALLDRPAERVAVNQDGTTSGFERWADVDLVSYELRQFGELVAASNFNAIEAVFAAEPVLNERPAAIRSLRERIETVLPMDLPARYRGMARENVAVARRDSAERAAAKHWLYALRGALAAVHVIEREAVLADVRTLSERVLGDADLAETLIAAKATGEGSLDPGLAERADDRVGALLDRTDAAEPAAKTAVEPAVDDWMRSVRGWT
ncbi:MAG: DNA polymerase beta superfamily protein [Haloarculaceae archaeon]